MLHTYTITADEITIGYTNDNKPIVKIISNIHEQRKERGTYADESKRRMWAKISYN